MGSIERMFGGGIQEYPVPLDHIGLISNSYPRSMFDLRESLGSPLSIEGILKKRVEDYKESLRFTNSEMGLSFILNESYWWNKGFLTVSGGAFDGEGNVVIVPYSRELYRISPRDRRIYQDGKFLLLTSQEYSEIERGKGVRKFTKLDLEGLNQRGLLFRKLSEECIKSNDILIALSDMDIVLVRDYAIAVTDLTERFHRQRINKRNSKSRESDEWPVQTSRINLHFDNLGMPYILPFHIKSLKNGSDINLMPLPMSANLVGTRLIDLNSSLSDEEKERVLQDIEARVRLGAPFSINGIRCYSENSKRY